MKKIIIAIIALLLIWALLMLYSRSSESEGQYSELEKPELLLFYNKDLITKPPLTWQELKDMKPSIALGRAENIKYSAEIMHLLAEQDNLVNALKFYTEFADKTKKVYTWDSSMQRDLDAFASNQIAMVFALKSDLPPSENHGLSPFPKIDLRQPNQEFPLLSEKEKIIYKDMIEQVALKKMTAEQVVEFYGY